MKKYIVVIIAALMLVACSKPVEPILPKEELIQPIYQRFLTACSGVIITDIPSQAVAYGTCMGYARGFADGHQVTIDGIQRGALDIDVQRARLWCIPPSTTNAVVMETIVAWISQYPNDFNKIMTQFNGINAATAVIVRALGTSMEFDSKKCNK